MQEEITVLDLAKGIRKLYGDFTEAVKELGGKSKGKNGSSKLGSSFAHWIGGSHVKTDRELLCEKFLQDVQSHLEMFLYALEGADEETRAQACAMVAETMFEPVPSKSNATTDLMKRAMIGQAKPILSYLKKEKLMELKRLLDASYNRWQRLPVEKEVSDEMGRLIQGR